MKFSSKTYLTFLIISFISLTLFLITSIVRNGEFEFTFWLILTYVTCSTLGLYLSYKKTIA